MSAPIWWPSVAANGPGRSGLLGSGLPCCCAIRTGRFCRYGSTTATVYRLRDDGYGVRVTVVLDRPTIISCARPISLGSPTPCASTLTSARSFSVGMSVCLPRAVCLTRPFTGLLTIAWTYACARYCAYGHRLSAFYFQARVISRFPGGPGRLSTSKPTARSVRLTWPFAQ